MCGVPYGREAFGTCGLSVIYIHTYIVQPAREGGGAARGHNRASGAPQVHVGILSAVYIEGRCCRTQHCRRSRRPAPLGHPTMSQARGLTVFISDLRNCTNPEQERKRVEKEMCVAGMETLGRFYARDAAVRRGARAESRGGRAHIRSKFTSDANMNGRCHLGPRPLSVHTPHATALRTQATIAKSTCGRSSTCTCSATRSTSGTWRPST